MRKRTAFTMLELIFVIVIMGILGKFGVEFLARAYDNFIFTKINNDLQARSGAAVEFIVKRLEHRIKKSANSWNTTTNTRNYLMGGVSDPSADVLEWIAADEDNFRGQTAPFWSGVIDLSTSTNAGLVSPGSNFATVSNTISVLSDGGSTLNNAAIYFIDSTLTATNPWGFNGNIADQSQTLHPVALSGTNNVLAPGVSNFSGVKASEYYKLTWTANAVAVENPHGVNNEMFDLYFYYDYQPWQGESYTNGKRQLLAEDISAFRFRSAGAMIKIQVCAKTDLTEEYALCKEKTVF